MIKYFLISSKKREHYLESIQAFFETADVSSVLEVIEELDSREETLNHIIESNKNCHIVCFADDIVLTHGWQRLITKHLHGITSLGFCTYHPDSKHKINYGYDLVNTDGEISTVPRRHWIKTNSDYPSDLSECTTFTGCFIAFSEQALKLLGKVPLEGKNRLGELLYHVQLKRLGGSVQVINHKIKHYGISTKKKSNIQNDSESYSVEKLIWESAVQKFPISEFAKPIQIKVSESLFELPENLMIWGAGSNAKNLFDIVGIDPDIYLSSFAEENNKTFLNGKILHYENYKFGHIENLLITVDHLSGTIAQLARKNFKVENLYILNVTFTDNEKILSAEKI